MWYTIKSFDFYVVGTCRQAFVPPEIVSALGCEHRSAEWVPSPA